MTEVKAKTGRKPGNPKTGGRQPGTPNVATARVRAAIAQLAEDGAPRLMGWIEETATGSHGGKPDPKGAAELMLKAMEYFVPKLQRVEHTGDAEKPVVVTRIELVGPSDNGAD